MKKTEIITAPADYAAPWWKKLSYGLAAGGVAFAIYLFIHILHRIYLMPWCIERMPKYADDYGCSLSNFPPMFGILLLFPLIGVGMLLYNAFTAHLKEE